MVKSTSNGKISKRYDDQFKAGAVRMVTEEGLSQSEVARRLGIADTTVSAWVRQLAPNGRLTDQEIRIKLRVIFPRKSGRSQLLGRMPGERSPRDGEVNQ